MVGGRFRTIGTGDNHIPGVQVEDLAKAYLLAIQKKPWGEKFIITDDSPCTTREFNNFMADCLDIPHPGKIPSFVVRMVIGKKEQYLFAQPLKSRGQINGRILPVEVKLCFLILWRAKTHPYIVGYSIFL